MNTTDITGLDKDCFPESAWNQDSWNQLLQQDHNQIFLHYSNSKITGFLLLSSIAGESELLKIGVSPSVQNQGIGRQLMEQMIHWCKAKKIKKIFLEVHQDNQSAIALYDMYQFSKIAVRKNYYRHPPGDALIYQFDFDF